MDTYEDYSRHCFLLAAEELEVGDLLRPVLRDLPGALDLPPLMPSYHNVSHCLRVGTFAAQLGKMAQLATQLRRELLVAGLFHDAGHSRTHTQADTLNVDRAVAIWRNAAAALPSLDVANVERLIRATTVTPDKAQRFAKATLEERIIADADLLPVVDLAYLRERQDGLVAEGYSGGDEFEFIRSAGAASKVGQTLYRLFGFTPELHVAEDENG